VSALGTVFFLAALVFIAVILLNEFYQERLGVPCTPTMGPVRAEMLACVVSPCGRIVELGSGWGGMAIAAARAHPEARVTGLELSLFPWLFSHARHLLHPALKNLSFERNDFFSYPLHDVSAVLCYLTNPLMAKLKDKLEHELPPGAQVISSTFFIPGWEPEQTVDVKGLWSTRIFVYRKKA
jgi:hypothetical protein